MPAKSTSLVKRPGKQFAKPRQLDSSFHFSLHFTLQPTFPSSPLLPTFPIVLVFAPRFTPLSSRTLTLLWNTLDSTLTPETTPVSTPLFFTFCITHHSTLQCALHSTLQSILHPPRLFHLTLHLFPPHFPRTPVPSTPLRNSASCVVPAFFANVQKPGQARG